MVAIVCQNAALDVPSPDPQSAMLENPINSELEVEVLDRRRSDGLVEKASRTSLLGSTGLMDESMSEYEEDMEPEEEEDIVEIFKKEAKIQTKTLSLDEKLERFNKRQLEKNSGSNNKRTLQKNLECSEKSTLQKNLESLDKKAQKSSLEENLEGLHTTQHAHKSPRRVVSTGTNKRNKLRRSLSLDGSKRHSWDASAKARKGKKPDFRWDKFKGGDEAENDSGEFRWDKLEEGCNADSPPFDKNNAKRTITPPPSASKKKEDGKPTITASHRPQIRPSRKPVRRTKSLSCSLESRLHLSQTKRPILQRTNSKVRFCMDSEVFEVPRCTKDMKPDLFYTKKEIKTFKAEKKEEKRELKQQKKLEKEKARARSKSPTPPKPIERVSSAPVSLATTA